MASSAAALARAFHDDPMFVFVEPDAGRRERVLPWFFGAVLRLGEHYGRVDRHGAVAAAIWLTPGRTDLGIRHLVGSGLVAAPVRLGVPAFRRFGALTSQIEDAGGRSGRGPRYWHLFVLGVDPAEQGRGIGSALVAPVLQRADRDGDSCYLETLHLSNLLLYERLGFHVADHVTSPGLPAFWTMVRPPR